MGTWKVEVEGAEEVVADILEDIHDGMDDAGERIAELAKDESKNVIRQNNAIFNEEVLRGFRIIKTGDSPTHVHYILANNVDHAPALNYGVDPIEYADGGPPVQALIPWVERHMGGWSLEHGDGGDSGGSAPTETEVRQIVRQAIEEATDGIDLSVDVYGTDDRYLDERNRFMENLLEGNSIDNVHVKRFYDNVRSWKSGGSKDLDEATEYAVFLKEALGIDAEPRGPAYQVDETPDGMKDLVESLHELSVEFMEAHYGEEFKAYRTLRNEAPDLSVEIWENPTAEKWTIPVNAVNNYTTTKGNLEGFDTALLHHPDLNTEDDLLMAVDALIRSDWEYEGEIHVRGSDSFEFDREDLDFQTQGYEDSVDFLADSLFEKGRFGSLQDPQMLAVAETIREMGQNRAFVESDDAKMRVHNFVDEFIERGLESDTSFDEQQWRRWESIITDDGPVLELAGQKRKYETGWATYHPSDTVDHTKTFTDQRVEVFNVHTEQFESGTILNREDDSPTFTVELDYGEIVTIRANHVNDWEVVAHESLRERPRSYQEDHVRNQATAIRLDGKFGIDKKEEIKDSFDRLVEQAKDLEHLNQVFHQYDRIDQLDSSRKSDGVAYDESIALKDSSTQSTTLHEWVHGVHKTDDYNSDRYSSKETEFFGHDYNTDGTHTSESWELIESYIQDTSTGDIPGDRADGAVPDVIQERASKVGDDRYDYEVIDGQEEQNALLDPIDGKIQPGDRLVIDMFHTGTDTYQVSSIEELEGDGIPDDQDIWSVNVAKINKGGSQAQIWVNEDGQLENMSGVTLKQYAALPDDSDWASMPSVELRRDTPRERLYEAANLAWAQQIHYISEMDNAADRLDEIPFISRHYSTRAANEVLTTGSELLFADDLGGTLKDKNWLTEANLRQLDRHYEFFIEAWLENFEPGEDAKEVLEKLGYDV